LFHIWKSNIFLIDEKASVSTINVALNINGENPNAARESVAFARQLKDKYQ